MKTLLALALLAGDPDAEWSSKPPSPAHESRPLPAASPPPSVEAVPMPAAPELKATHPLEQQLDTTRPLESRFRLGLQLDVGASPDAYGQLGATLDVAWFPLRYVRLHANVGTAWLPTNGFLGFNSHGGLRLMGGADGVLPLSWGELFVGLETGTTYTDLQPNFFGCVQCPWTWQPTLRARTGFDVTTLRPLILGADIGYGLIAPLFGEVHLAEVHGRLGFAL